MTNRDFYTAVIENRIDETVIAHATAAIEQLDKTNANAQKKRMEKQAENEPIKVAIVELVSNGGKVASEIASTLNVSVQKVNAMCRQLVAENRVTAEKVSVPGKGKALLYSVA